MTRAVVASVDVPRTAEGGDPAVALLGFDGTVHLAEPVDGSLEALTDLLSEAGGSGADVFVDLPLSGTVGPVDEALQRAGLPPRFWKEEALERGRTVSRGIAEALESAKGNVETVCSNRQRLGSLCKNFAQGNREVGDGSSEGYGTSKTDRRDRGAGG